MGYNGKLVLCGGDANIKRGASPAECFIAEVGGARGATWDKMEPMQISRIEHTLTVVGPKLYAIGGIDKNKERLYDYHQREEQKNVEVYDGESWSQAGWAINTTLSNHCSVAVSGNEIVVTGRSETNFI